MRRAALFFLLATAAAPTLAQDRDDRDSRREQAREQRAERAEAREERREERSQRAERNEPSQEARVESGRDDRSAGREDRREAAQQRQTDRRADREDRAAVNLEQRRQAAEHVRDQRNERRDDRIERRAERRAPPVVSNVPREGTQPPPPVSTAGRSSRSHHWNGSWRNDHRYDWYNWRNRHRSLFRLGFYYDPFGWSYRPYSIGWRMWPNYYRNSFWLNDPWMYRLPPAYPGTRWIRYYDDAILVDTWSGEVVDVIYGFFW